MNLNDLLEADGIDPRQVIVMRHRPSEPELNKVLPWLAAEEPDVFNAYQQTQGERLENAMLGGQYVASFIGHEPGKALFVGLYGIGPTRPLTFEQYWNVPQLHRMKKFGLVGFQKGSREHTLWFDLQLRPFHSEWKGKLVVGWPPPERSWWRRSHKNVMPVLAIREESALNAAMPDWNRINLTWNDLAVLPSGWRNRLAEWRAIYFIFDESDRRGYVGSAYGADNLLGRWRNYGASGHGGNRLLRERRPENFRFSILQRVSPDMDRDDVIRLEATWKERLHTRAPVGLNDN